jgi:ferric-dicitrate binding protein FerR (iron transport regulator)
MREIGFGLILSSAMALVAFLIAAWPVTGRPIAAFFPSGTSQPEMARAVSLAGGSLLELDGAEAVVVSVGEGTDYAMSLYRAGAWLVVDGSLAQSCVRRVRNLLNG